MWRRTPQTVIALLPGILSCCLLGCGGKAQSSTSPSTAQPNAAVVQPLEVKVYDVVPSVARGDLLIPASLSIEGVAVITSRRDGLIAQLSVKQGSHISKGSVLAKLGGDEELRAQLRQAEVELDRLKVVQRQLEALIRL